MTRRSQVQILPPLRREPLGLPHIPRVFSRLGSSKCLHTASMPRASKLRTVLGPRFTSSIEPRTGVHDVPDIDSRGYVRRPMSPWLMHERDRSSFRRDARGRRSGAPAGDERGAGGCEARGAGGGARPVGLRRSRADGSARSRGRKHRNGQLGSKGSTSFQTERVLRASPIMCASRC